MNHGVTDLSTRLEQLIWYQPIDRKPAWQRSGIHLARLVYAIYRDVALDHLTLHATSLVYTTLLSLVPLLAVSFSALKGFGVHNELEPTLLELLAPLGERSIEVAHRIIGFVDNMRVGVLGSVGLAMLIYTVISLIQKIEQAFNYTWRVDTPRSFPQRFSRYLSVLLLGPVLFFSTVGAAASLMSTSFVQTLVSIRPFGAIVESAGRMIPYLLITSTFAFVYVFMPNAKVRLSSALVGALVAGALWQTGGWVFATFMVGSTKYDAIYSSLAILILFMIWVYLAWLILLIGASIAFYFQHPEFLTTPTRELRLSNRARERLALVVAGRIAARQYSDAPPWTSQTLAITLQIPGATTDLTLAALEAGGVLARTATDPPGFLLSRAPETVSVQTLLDYVRSRGESRLGAAERADPAVEIIEQKVQAAINSALSGYTLKDLVQHTADDRHAETGHDTERGAGEQKGASPT
ncbi:MAG: YihY/virulence factor BrkB family protein [Chromatiaceae bacterium]